ncbi:MutS-related protein [Flexithrix dorotheae]|uniref:MutS-related protein n=1 Tax=Flexithrix dorotheae TaxID=70993 RepID=UPI000378250D|nr:hypothetical protein [Flexithrix dorotheae]
MKIYHENLLRYEDLASKLKEKLKMLSIFRLAVFVISTVIILVLANQRLFVWFIIATPICIFSFLVLVKKYNNLKNSYRHTLFLKSINEQEILRLDNKLNSFPEGKEFIKREHAYNSDLDIFGTHSVFQLINRATTGSGNNLLAEWLSTPANRDEIISRQEAVKELSSRLNWRQNFQALGTPYKGEGNNYFELISWIDKPVKLLPNRHKYKVLSIVMAFLAIVSLGSFFYYISSPAWPVFFLFMGVISIINHQILKRVKEIAVEIVDHVDQNLKLLKGYEALIKSIVSEEFESKKLRSLQLVLRANDYSAASEITKLKQILLKFQHKATPKSPLGNQLYPMFNNLLLLDIHFIIETEKWKVRNQKFIKGWAEAVSTFEVLNSIAGFSYSNPGYGFPEIREEDYHIKFKDMGHPLLPSEKRVCNDFQLEKKGEIAMVTGSNMAGKSTFLRTIGVNLVLAFMGAPCCSKAASISTIHLFTSMRTQDNLEEGVSSFYAELNRIKKLLALIQTGKPTFFLLDEMFKGTNSEDRYKGGISLIKQLSELNASGIISTHDLELAKLVGKHLMVENYSFNSEIKDGEMLFNYTLTSGICKDFNASELMRRSGINIIPQIEDLK